MPSNCATKKVIPSSFIASINSYYGNKQYINNTAYSVMHTVRDNEQIKLEILRNEPDLSTRSPIVTLSSLKYLTFQPMPY
jgi:hypothetical protein